MNSDEPLRCDVCGKFMGTGGKRTLITPDSDYSTEQYETLCGECIKRPQEEGEPE